MEALSRPRHAHLVIALAATVAVIFVLLAMIFQSQHSLFRDATVASGLQCPACVCKCEVGHVPRGEQGVLPSFGPATRGGGDAGCPVCAQPPGLDCPPSASCPPRICPDRKCDCTSERTLSENALPQPAKVSAWEDCVRLEVKDRDGKTWTSRGTVGTGSPRAALFRFVPGLDKSVSNSMSIQYCRSALVELPPCCVAA